MRGQRPPLILVTDPAFTDDRIALVVETVGRALAPGLFAVQLRDKSRPRASLEAFAERLREVTARCGTALVINGDARLAKAVGADGVHLGGLAGTVLEARRIVGEAAWISVAAHDDADVEAGRDAGADAILVSPIFATPGKGAPRGVAALRAAKAVVGDVRAGSLSRVAIHALGGVEPASARQCREAGADGVAVVRALLAAKDAVTMAAVARALVGPFVED